MTCSSPWRASSSHKSGSTFSFVGFFGGLLASNVSSDPRARRFQLAMVNRHLHRPTLGEIAEALDPGGLLLFHTFMEGGLSRRFGRRISVWDAGCEHPSDPEHLLKSGELRETFRDLEILRDEELAGEDGRPMSFFIARKDGRWAHALSRFRAAGVNRSALRAHTEEVCELPAWLNSTQLVALAPGDSGTKEPEVALK